MEGTFRLSIGETLRDFASEFDAMAAGAVEVRRIAAGRAEAAGTDTAEIELRSDLTTAIVEGQRTFVEAILTAVASGRPRIAI